jgi:hypothetical protein
VISRRTAVVFAVILAAFGLAEGSAGAGSGNAPNAKLCQKSGWQTVETETGVRFANADECTSYAATGGTLYRPTLMAVFDGCLGVGYDGQVTYYALYVFNLSGFHPDSIVTFRLPGSPYPLPGFTVTTDASGSASTAPSALIESPGEPGSLEATDAEGVDASVGFTAAVC